jgi:hypothetical protein
MRKSCLLLVVVLLSLLNTALIAVEIRQIGNYNTPNQAVNVEVVGNLAYVADMQSGLRIIDISDPENPDEIGHYDTPGWVEYVYIAGHYAYLADYTSGLRILDISDPENPESVGTFDTRSAAHAVNVIGNYAYIADWAGLSVIDVSDPAHPDEVAYLDTPGCAYGIFVLDNYAYVAAQASGVLIIDISDPENPEEVGNYPAQHMALGIYVVGDIAYVGAGSNGFHVVDVSNPEEPERLGICDTQDWAQQINVDRNYAYVGDRSGGLRMIDISNPEDPEEVGHCGLDTYTLGSEIVGNIIYTANWTRGLAVLRVTGLGLTINPMEIDFEEVGINHSRDLPLTIENNGENNITISDIEVDGDRFSVNFEGEFTLEPYEECELNVTFSPDERGEFEGSLMITSDDENNENVEILLRGIGLGPVIGIDPQVLEFGAVGLNIATELSLTISNQGLNDLVISNISSNNEVFNTNFEEGITLEPEAEVEILVTFTPNESGEFAGLLTITSNDQDNEQTGIELTGVGVGAVLWYHPNALGFGVVGINIESEQRISFRNRGLIDLVISDFSNGNEAFTVNIDDDIVLGPDETYRLYITFTPTDGIEYRDTLTFLTNDPDNETAIATLSGRGQGAVIVVEPDTIQFNEVGRNRSVERVIEIRNAGEIELNISEIFVEGRYFSIDLDTTYVVEVDGCLECTATFAPEEIGDFRATLFISCDDRQREEVVIPLYGTGAGPCIGVDCDSLNFGLFPCGESCELFVTISAEGLTDLTVSEISIEGDQVFQSAIEEEIFIELNDNFELPVIFTPMDDCFYTARLIIHSDDQNNSEKYIDLYGSSHRGILLTTSDDALGITVNGSYAYVACSNYLNIFEISDPTHPQELTPFDLNGLTAENIVIVDTCAFVSVGEDGFIIVDVTDPDSLEIVGSYDTPGYAWDIAVYDGYGYVADGESGVRVIDVLDHNRLAEVSYYDTPGLARDVCISGEYAYVADDVQGLRIIDISNPQEIDEIGYCNTRGWSYEVSVQGNYAYVADERHGVRVIDVSNPQDPSEIGFYDTNENAYAVDVDGCHAFVADGAGGVDLLDITEPENPSSVKVFYTPGAANDISISGNYIFITTEDYGLQIINVSEFLKVDDPDEDIIPYAFILQPAFPNPFNAVTSIRYGLPYSTYVSISIYDVTGRMIAELYNGESQAGFQTVNWNAEGFRSGVYLVRLRASSGFSTVQKVMLIR